MPQGMHVLPKYKGKIQKMLMNQSTVASKSSDLPTWINSARGKLATYTTGQLKTQKGSVRKKRPEESGIRADSITGKSETKSSLWIFSREIPQENMRK